MCVLYTCHTYETKMTLRRVHTSAKANSSLEVNQAAPNLLTRIDISPISVQDMFHQDPGFIIWEIDENVKVRGKKNLDLCYLAYIETNQQT